MKKGSYIIFIFIAAISFATGVVMKEKIVPDAMAKTVPENVQPTTQYTECFGATLWLTPGKSLNDGQIPEKTVKIPSGWTVVGGGYGGGGQGYTYAEPVMILCR